MLYDILIIQRSLAQTSELIIIEVFCFWYMHWAVARILFFNFRSVSILTVVNAWVEFSLTLLIDSASTYLVQEKTCFLKCTVCLHRVPWGMGGGDRGHSLGSNAGIYPFHAPSPLGDPQFQVNLHFPSPNSQFRTTLQFFRPKSSTYCKILKMSLNFG